MRETLELTEEQSAVLDSLSRERNLSKLEVIARALEDFHRRPARPGLNAAFGLWEDRKEDGLAYQLRMRSEWDREWD